MSNVDAIRKIKERHQRQLIDAKATATVLDQDYQEVELDVTNPVALAMANAEAIQALLAELEDK